MDRIDSRKIFKELVKVISFDSKYRSYIFSFILVYLYLVPLSILESYPKLSLCAKILGAYCPSGGITRGVSSLIKGDLFLAINYNFLSIPVFLVMVSIILFDIFKKFRE
jgi:hypothetical protein